MKLQVIDFYAVWCGPCKHYSTIVDQINLERKDVQIEKVDVDKDEGSVTKYGIRSVPTTVILKDGEVVEKRSGIIPKDELNQMIDKHINS